MAVRSFFYSFLLLCILAGAFLGWVVFGFSASGPLEQPVTIVIPPATHFTAIADSLAENNIIAHPLLFKILVYGRGEASRFKAGEYAFPAHISAREAAAMMAAGKTVVHQLKIPEGLMTVEIIDLVKKADGLDGEITLDLHDGDLLPETYNYSRGDKRNDILSRMHRAMEKTLNEAWEGREPGLPFADARQALILASIVEKETGLPSERPHVAGVYINRLRKNMLLQADPTTAYAVTRGTAKLTRPLTTADLLMDSPYNTYRVLGLPPGPIANPGKASIFATLHPLATNDLYFVATGTGGHNFAATVEEHEINVQKYRTQMKLQGSR